MVTSPNANRRDNCYHVISGYGDSTTLIDGFTITAGHADLSPTSDFSGTSGGGMITSETSNVRVENCWFIFNYALHDGGALNSRGSIEVTDCQFTMNFGGNGGAIYSGSHGAPQPGGVFRNLTIWNNASQIEGGGMQTGYSNGNVIENCVFHDNTAGAGGGGLYLGASDNTTIRNSVFFDNTAAVSGGAIRIVGAGSDDSTMINNVTIVRNVVTDTGGRGGGLAQDDIGVPTTTILNSIFWDNQADDQSEIFNAQLVHEALPTVVSMVTLDFSTVEGGPAATDGVEDLLNVFNWSPLFVDLAGANPNLSLQQASPMIDNGDPSGNYTGQTDIDEEKRTMVAPCKTTDVIDIGADEFFYPTCWNGSAQCFGDANGDGWVRVSDAVIWLQANGATFGDAAYNECADVDRNGSVDALDSDIIGAHMNTNPTPSCDCNTPWPPQ